MFLTLIFTVLYVGLVQVHADAAADNCLKRGPPRQIRIALRGPNAVTISWRTYGRVAGSFPHYEIVNDTPSPIVEYSTVSTFSNSSLSENGTSTNYTHLLGVSFFHNCAVNVEPSTKYYYRILASDPCVTESKPHSFTAPPAVSNSSSTNIVIVGDLGNNKILNLDSATKTIEALAEAANNTDLFVHVGDISYADDPEVLPFQLYEDAWETFQDNMEIVTADNIYMTLPGNHEVTCNQNGDLDFCQDEAGQYFRNFTAYLNRFRMPGNESGGYSNLWYSFDYGLVHFVVINTETDFTDAPAGPGKKLNGGNFAPNGTQYNWLKTDLEAADKNRKNFPWIIVSGHRPLYGSRPYYLPGVQHDDICYACRDAFADLIFNNSVDFYFCGHVHWYERLFPIDRNGMPLAYDYNNRTGLIHVTTGAGGAAEGANFVESGHAAIASAKILSEYGYTRLEIKDSSNCRLSFHNSRKNMTEDPVNIYRTH